MSRALDIGLDVDNVLYPFSTVITRWVERRKHLAPGTLDDVALSWTWYKDQWGITSEEFVEHFTAGVQAGVVFNMGEPEPGALSTARRLHEAGHRLHYVSAREIPGVSAAEAHAITEGWLVRHGFPRAGALHISDDKTVVPTDVFLDDGVHNITTLVEAGHPVPLLWDRPHNRGAWLTHPAHRVHSWHGFERVVSVVARLAPMRDTLAWDKVAA